MVIKHFRLDDYLFCVEARDLSEREYQRIQKLLRRELSEIFYGRNLGRNLEYLG
jgi:S-adenosylmethionine decarboxylase